MSETNTVLMDAAMRERRLDIRRDLEAAKEIVAEAKREQIARLLAAVDGDPDTLVFVHRAGMFGVPAQVPTIVGATIRASDYEQVPLWSLYLRYAEVLTDEA